MNHFEPLIIWSFTYVYTDSRNIISRTNATFNPRMFRLKILLQDFSYQIHNVTAQNNAGADMISRINIIKSFENSSDENLIHYWHEKLLHPGQYKLKKTLEFNNINLPIKRNIAYQRNCHFCKMAKGQN